MLKKSNINNKINTNISKKKKRNEEYLKYQRYIRSKQFKEIKKIILERDDYKCACCNSRAEERSLTCHHKTYQHLYDELNHLNDLIILCNVCHKAIHSAISNKHLFKMKNEKDDSNDLESQK